MTTHTTATAPTHPAWMPYAYYDHQWEGYPGSNVLIYDPASGKLEDLGIPVPRTTIYGGVYEASTNSYYMGCYMRGHVYRYDLLNRHLKDYGQVTEMASFRYIVGPDDNVYFSSKSGTFLRINTKEDRVEDLGIEFPVYDHLPITKVHNQMLFAAIGPDGKLYLNAAYGEELLRYDFTSNALERLGRFAPEEFLSYDMGLQTAVGLCFDGFGILWYAYQTGQTLWLASWDILSGKKPRQHGILGTPDRRVGYASEMHIHEDVLYVSDTNHAYDPPGILSVRLETVRRAQPEVLCRDAYHFLRFSDHARYIADIAVEGERFYERDLLKGAKDSAFMQANPVVFTTPRRFLTKAWKHLPIEESSVQSVAYDADGNVEAICGNGPHHSLTLKNGVVLAVARNIEYTPVDREAIAAKFSDIRLPARPGRQYLALANAHAPLSGQRELVGTRDGMLAIVAGGKAYALGACAQHGPVHAIATSSDGRLAVGVAGDPRDMGTVFTYDDEQGLQIIGRIYICDPSSVGGLGASCEPYTTAFSPDDAALVIGARDRLGCVYEYDMREGIAGRPMF